MMKETEKIEITVNLQEYLRKGFGSMNKNDFEVFIFNELIKEKYADKSDNAISRELKINSCLYSSMTFAWLITTCIICTIANIR